LPAVTRRGKKEREGSSLRQVERGEGEKKRAFEGEKKKEQRGKKLRSVSVGKGCMEKKVFLPCCFWEQEKGQTEGCTLLKAKTERGGGKGTAFSQSPVRKGGKESCSRKRSFHFPLVECKKGKGGGKVDATTKKGKGISLHATTSPTSRGLEGKEKRGKNWKTTFHFEWKKREGGRSLLFVPMQGNQAPKKKKKKKKRT